MRMFIVTSDRSMWALRGCLHQLDKYWPNHPEVVVAGFSAPDLPLDIQFHRIGDFSDYPVNRWSDGVKKFLGEVSDDHFVWHMDDFWLNRPVDEEAIEHLGHYMVIHPELARIDLTADRALGANMRQTDKIGHLDIITNDFPVPYILSFQTGIWRRTALWAYLQSGETPWQVELEGTTRMERAGSNVVGTLQEPVSYSIVVQQGVLVAYTGGYQDERYRLSKADLDELEGLGYLHK